MLIAAITLLLTGAALLTRGLIGRRIGQEPRCRKCNYNLTGVESKECPECGVDLSESAQCVGQRHRKLSRLASGVPLLMLGAGLISDSWLHWSHGITWYRCLPTSLLARPALFGNANAKAVLTERCSTNRLSRADAQLIAQSVITLAEDSDIRRLDQQSLDLFELLRSRRLVPPDQTDRVYRQLVRPSLAVRPLVRQGDTVPIVVTCSLRTPSGTFLRYEVIAERLKIDGREVAPFSQKIIESTWIRASGWSEGSLEVPLNWLSVGSHAIELDLKVMVFAGTIQLVERNVACNGECHVLGPHASDSVKTQKLLASALRDDLEVRAFLEKPSAPGKEAEIWTSIRWRGNRRGILCGKFTMRDSKRRVLHTMTRVLRPTDSGLTGGCTVPFPPAEGDLVSVTFESSRRQARATTDVMEMYDGNVIFDNIRVNPLPQVPPANKAGQSGS